MDRTNNDYRILLDKVFPGLEEELAFKLLELLEESFYQEGSIIFMEGDPGNEIYFLRQGLVKLSKVSIDGDEHILSLIIPGQVFAEILLFEGGPYPATATAMEDCYVGKIKNRKLEQLIRAEPEVGVQLLRIMSRRLRRAQERIKELALKDVRSRTATLLREMAKRHGGKGLSFEFKSDRNTMAKMIGTTRESLTRALSEMKRDGIIAYSRNRFEIIDLEALEEIID